MRILLCHNYYKLAGGEDRCFEDESAMLKSRGHEVVCYTKRNDAISGIQQLNTAAQAIWNRQTVRDIRLLIRQHQIELVHCTNSFPVISPSLYYACRKEGVPVIQSLQNYRLFCSNSYFLRDGKVCEQCVGKAFPWPAVQHGCYRDSRLGSTIVATMQAIHHGIGSWSKRVDRFIAVTQFARQKYIECGLPGDRISIKPNFIDPVPPMGTGGNAALFVGRFSPEKGIDLLLDAWSDPRCHLPLHFVGDGPLKDRVIKAMETNPKIKYLGSHAPDKVLDIMSNSRFIIVPSIWYEGLPRTNWSAKAPAAYALSPVMPIPSQSPPQNSVTTTASSHKCAPRLAKNSSTATRHQPTTTC
jgi:glycosyltransferase involved in cell wall biosynthesis